MLGASSLGEDLIIAVFAIILAHICPAWLPNIARILHDIATENAGPWGPTVQDAVVTWRRSCSFPLQSMPCLH